jgi:cytochrome P450
VHHQPATTEERLAAFPLGARLSVEQLSEDPHPHLARLRAAEPVSWVPAIDGWLVTSHDLALAVMRDAARFTVEDPRFSTARVVGPSMLSLDGERHARNREPFAAAMRPGPVRERFAGLIEAEVAPLLDVLEPCGQGELRRQFAGPLAARVLAGALGLDPASAPELLALYDGIVAAVTAISRGERPSGEAAAAFSRLEAMLRAAPQHGEERSLLAVAGGCGLGAEEVVSNAAVLLFGGIETTEGMIANAVLALLLHPAALAAVRDSPGLAAAAIEESLRLEPAAAAVDRYAAASAQLGAASIRRGELVRVSLSAANRDPAVFARPERFELGRLRGRRHLAFAQGPHVCLGVHLARLEARLALRGLLERLPALRLDPDRPATVHGLIFRKPRALHVLWS